MQREIAGEEAETHEAAQQKCAMMLSSHEARGQTAFARGEATSEAADTMPKMFRNRRFVQSFQGNDFAI